MDSTNERHWHVNKVKQNCGLYYMFGAPGTIYGWNMYSTQLRFIWDVTNDGAPDSSNRVRGLNDRSCSLIGEAA